MSDEINWVDKECKEVEWYTPEKILAPIRDLHGGQIHLDPATAKHNPTQAHVFYTKEDDGLSKPWTSPVFVNPPYGKVIRDWASKIHEEASRGLLILALLPCGARFSTKYWQQHVLCPELSAVCFVKGRVAFVDVTGKPVKGNPYDSCIYGYNIDKKIFAERLSSLGATFGMEKL